MITAYHQVEALEDALRLVADGAIPIAGATSLYTSKPKRDVAVVDVTRLGLDRIEVNGDHIHLGSSVTLTQLAQAENLPGAEGELLRLAASSIATHPLRNAITLGGNVAQRVYWADIPVVLTALGAQIGIRQAEEPERLLPIADCLQSSERPWTGGLITRFVIPRRDEKWGYGYERFTRTVGDYPLATACVTLGTDDGTIRDLRIVLGAIQTTPHRARRTESALAGKPFDAEALREAVDELGRSVSLISNYRTPEDYRRTLVSVLVRRAFTSAFELARHA